MFRRSKNANKGVFFPKNYTEFVKLYENITRVVKYSLKDKFLEQMFEKYQKQKNYKYTFNC